MSDGEMAALVEEVMRRLKAALGRQVRGERTQPQDVPPHGPVLERFGISQAPASTGLSSDQSGQTAPGGPLPDSSVAAPNSRPYPDVLKVREVTAILNCGRTTVYELYHRGELHGFRLGAGQGGLRILAASLVDFMRRRLEGSRCPSGLGAEPAAGQVRPPGTAPRIVRRRRAAMTKGSKSFVVAKPPPARPLAS